MFNAVTGPIELTPSEKIGRGIDRSVAGALLALLAGVWIWELRGEWSANPQYLHGWGVPFLGAYLFWKRWEMATPPGGGRRVGGLLVLAGTILWGVTTWIKGANPDWRLLHSGLTIGLFAICLGWLALAGGWRWSRQFLFPLLFLFTAVPWPTFAENALLTGLQSWVTTGSVELLQWLGVEAYRTGSVIHLESARLGVEEACSGMRSLQTALMLGLFAGELWNYRLRGRIMLLLGAIAVALLLNLLRTFALSYQATTNLALAESWHDPAGWIVLGLLAAVVLSAGWWWRQVPGLGELESNKGRVWPVSWLGGAVACLIAVQVFTFAWYRQAVPTAEWVNLWPGSVASTPMPDRVAQVLKAARTKEASVWMPNGTHWAFYEVRWEPGSPGAPQAKYHTPEICLPAIGLEQRRVEIVPGKGSRPPFRMYEFDYLGKPLYVFYTFLENGRASDKGPVTYELALVEFEWGHRLKRAINREKLGRQELFEVAISNARGPAAAREQFLAFLEKGGRS